MKNKITLIAKKISLRQTKMVKILSITWIKAMQMTATMLTQ